MRETRRHWPGFDKAVFAHGAGDGRYAKIAGGWLKILLITGELVIC